MAGVDALVVVGVGEEGEADLAFVGEALHASRCSRAAERGEENADEEGNDADHDQQLNEREGGGADFARRSEGLGVHLIALATHWADDTDGRGGSEGNLRDWAGEFADLLSTLDVAHEGVRCVTERRGRALDLLVELAEAVEEEVEAWRGAGAEVGVYFECHGTQGGSTAEGRLTEDVIAEWVGGVVEEDGGEIGGEDDTRLHDGFGR